MNDLQYGTDILNPIMLADDTSLFSLHSNIKDLFEIANEEIKIDFEWRFIDKLSLNADKAKYIFCHKQRDKDYSVLLAIFKNQKHLSDKI